MKTQGYRLYQERSGEQPLLSLSYYAVLIKHGCSVFYLSKNLKSQRAEQRKDNIKRRQSARRAADYNQY